MNYIHSFIIHSSLAEVRDFHTRSSSMGAITPPPAVVRIHSAPEILRDGDEMDFTLWMLFIPLHWIARIEGVTSNGFVDRQLRGPFKSWQHRHTFSSKGKNITEVQDEVQATLSRNPILWIIGAGMWVSLPLLFAYRGWKTKKLLQK